MKVILTNSDQEFAGYEKLTFEEIDKVHPGEATEVYVSEFIANSFTREELEPALMKIFSKLTFLGKAIITLVNVPLFVKNCMYGEVDESLFPHINSYLSWKDIRAVGEKMGLSLTRCELNGSFCIIEMVRGNE